MNIHDRVILASWLASNVSLSDVMSYENVGIVGNVRFSESARKAYVFIWSWSAPRFHGNAGTMQEHVYNKYGMKALTRRYARINRLIDSIKGAK